MLAEYDASPPQSSLPDDSVPNRTGLSNEQLAIRMLTEVVSGLCIDVAQLRFDQDESGTDLLQQLQAIASVFELTERS
jgi:hypothetical protein